MAAINPSRTETSLTGLDDPQLGTGVRNTGIITRDLRTDVDVLKNARIEKIDAYEFHPILALKNAIFGSSTSSTTPSVGDRYYADIPNPKPFFSKEEKYVIVDADKKPIAFVPPRSDLLDRPSVSSSLPSASAIGKSMTEGMKDAFHNVADAFNFNNDKVLDKDKAVHDYLYAKGRVPPSTTDERGRPLNDRIANKVESAGDRIQEGSYRVGEEIRSVNRK